MTRQRIILITITVLVAVVVVWAISYVMLIVPSKSGGGVG